jgi:hypothetical protein
MKWPRKVGHAIITSSCHFPRPGPDPIESLLATANPCFAFVDPMTISTTTTTATTSTDANPNESKNTSIWCGNNYQIFVIGRNATGRKQFFCFNMLRCCLRDTQGLD